MNDVSNGQTPFQINPFFFDDPTKGMNYTADRCNEPSQFGGSKLNLCVRFAGQVVGHLQRYLCDTK